MSSFLHRDLDSLFFEPGYNLRINFDVDITTTKLMTSGFPIARTMMLSSFDSIKSALFFILPGYCS
jgi:hypothetical protein